MSPPRLVDHFFRHEYGRLVATLVRRVGTEHLATVEDAAQSALMKALDAWRSGLPDDPTAWVFHVAQNDLLGELRRRSRRRRLATSPAEAELADEPAAPHLASEVDDDLLRMLFVCCDDALPSETQLVLALKTLCGFGVREIALRLFMSEAHVYKRLARARARLRRDPPRFDGLSLAQLVVRRPAVHRVLYLLFTEGHLSAHAELAIRVELCAEAIRLGAILAAHPVGDSPETAALMALMHLHAARLPARQDPTGGLLLLEEQDRDRWDRVLMERGVLWLARSARGDKISRYHVEAGIAAEHALAPSFAATRWTQIAESYALLEQIAPSPLHRLNRALATAEAAGADAGLDVLVGFEPPTWLAGSYLWSAALADLHRRAAHPQQAEHHLQAALELAPSPAVRALIERRFHRASS
ncbi:MAG: sigma-70 family RNA polymerase sigma factor [Myxococcales bacterium]|nr:sigma-70 family RNA polymerase sigma factor [Myxococcales bacterium]